MNANRFVCCEVCADNLLRCQPDGTFVAVQSLAPFDPEHQRWNFTCRCGAKPVLRKDSLLTLLADTSSKRVSV